MKSGFLSRVLDRAEKIDKERIVDYIIEIAEERDLMVLIFDNMIEGMTVIDEEETVVYINYPARQILDLGDGPTIPNLPMKRLLNYPDLLFLCREGISSQDPIFAREFTLRLPNGRRFLKVNMIPLDKSGNRIGTLILFVDETERKVQEQKLRETEKLAALTTLSAGMSHEIRNPLNSLSIHLQLLKRHLKNKNIHDEETDEAIRIVNDEIQRMNDVIESFLSAVRPSEQKIRLVSLYKIVTETLSLMEPEFRDRQIRVSLHEEGEWPYLKVDDTQFKQALINILRNAVDAIVSKPEEERWKESDEVLIRMIRGQDKVTLQVTDTGKGIEPEDLNHIFEPYFTTKPKGTGLGLMIVDRIIREHNGSIKADSVPGEGTRITMTLPVDSDHLPLLKDGGAEETSG